MHLKRQNRPPAVFTKSKYLKLWFGKKMRNQLTWMVLALLALGCSRGVSRNASVPLTEATAQVLVDAVAQYAADCGVVPQSDTWVRALLDDPSAAGWAGPYIRRTPARDIPLDAWGEEFQMQVTPQGSIRVISAGADRIMGTNDDITKQTRSRTSH